MHIIDIIFLCITAVIIILGIRRGLITEAFRLAALASGVVCAVLFYRPAAAMLGFTGIPGGVRISIGFVAVFAMVMAGVMAAGWAVRKVVHLTVLGWIDRLCGGIIGLAKCVLVAWVCTLVAGALPIPAMHAYLKRSVVYAACARVPLKLRMPGSGEIDRQFESIVDTQAISDIPVKLREFREKVDSAKGAIQ